MKLSYVCVSVYVFDCLYSPGLCFGCLEPDKGNALHNSRDLLNINHPDSCKLARPLPCKVMLSISFQLSQHSFDLISSPFAIRVNSFNSVFLLFIYLFIYLFITPLRNEFDQTSVTGVSIFIPANRGTAYNRIPTSNSCGIDRLTRYDFASSVLISAEIFV